MKSPQQGDKYKQTSKKKRIFNRQPAAPAHYNRMLATSANLQVLEINERQGDLQVVKKLAMNFVQINLHHSKTATAILFFYFPL
jgi:hypothetical protein